MRKRRSKTLRRMGRAKRNPSLGSILRMQNAMGFALLYPSYTRFTYLRRNQQSAFAIPSPKPFVGQLRATPPAIDPVVAPHVVFARKN